MGGVRHSREQWLLWIRDQRSSGMTIVAFCESVGIRENSFYRWRAKLAAEGETFVGTTDDGGALANGHLPGEDGEDASPFVPLHVVASDRIEIDLPCGAVVRVPPDDAMVACVLRGLFDVDRGEPSERADAMHEDRTSGEGGAAC